MCCLRYPSPSVTAAIIIQQSLHSSMIKVIGFNETVRTIVIEVLIDYLYR